MPMFVSMSVCVVCVCNFFYNNSWHTTQKIKRYTFLESTLKTNQMIIIAHLAKKGKRNGGWMSRFSSVPSIKLDLLHHVRLLWVNAIIQ